MRRPGLIISVSRIGKELGVDPVTILATSHGRRSIDVLKLYDEKKANWECKQKLLEWDRDGGEKH